MFPSGKQQILCLENLNTDHLPTQNLNIVRDPSAGLHVLFTSGSTGKPKGIAASQQAALSRICWLWGELELTADDVFCQRTSLNFVDSTWEIFGALLHGIPLVIADDETSRDPEALINLLTTYSVTHITLVPSLLQAMLEANDRLGERLPRLRTWITTGEPLTDSLLVQFRAAAGGRRLLNSYGTTETWDPTLYDTSTDAVTPGFQPIGRAIGNMKIYLLDAQLEPVPIGVPGEICVGGLGVTSGYLDEPELTARRFQPNPFAAGRLYRTGDIGCFRPDGNISFKGRTDNQVKVRGFRIELAEIETVLRRDEQVAEAVVCLLNPGTPEQRLVAYIVGAATENRLRDLVLNALPAHMAPSAYVFLDSLPLTPNGKTDRNALPEPGMADCSDSVPPNPGTETTVAQIWSEFLMTPVVNRQDDFFAIGGHSLMALRIIRRLREDCHTGLTIADLFRSPTVAALAAEIDWRAETGSTGAIEEFKTLMPIRTEGSRPPLFCVHGEPLRMARNMDPELPVYGLYHVYGNNYIPPETVEELAQQHCREIRMVQPAGPYHLCGYCLGGALAFEIAQQLTDQGEEVAYLALIEPAYSNVGGEAKTRRQWLSELLRELGPSTALLKYLTVRLFRSAYRRCSEPAKRIAGKIYERLGSPPPLEVRKAQNQAYMGRLTRAYRYRPLDINAEIFVGDAVTHASDVIETYWLGLCTRGCQVSRISGAHYHLQLMEEPFVSDMAAKIDCSMKSSQQNQPGIPTA